MQELMTLTQAASQLGVSPNTVTAWAAKLNIDLRLHPHDKRIKMLSTEEVEEIRQAIADRNILIAPARPRALPAPPPMPRLPSSPTSTDLPHRAPRGHSGGSHLPEGLVSLYSFCKVHEVDLRDAQDAIDRGYITITEGEWRVGPNIVKRALNEEQQVAFLEWLQRRRGD